MSAGDRTAATHVMMVIDCSVTMAWCFEDEATPFTREILQRLADVDALVPLLWPLEVANVLALAERRGRITRAKATAFIELLGQLPIVPDEESAQRSWGSVIELCREQRLSAYDAAYLDVALRRDVPLATLDVELRAAAQRVGVTLVGPSSA